MRTLFIQYAGRQLRVDLNPYHPNSWAKEVDLLSVPFILPALHIFAPSEPCYFRPLLVLAFIFSREACSAPLRFAATTSAISNLRSTHETTQIPPCSGLPRRPLQQFLSLRPYRPSCYRYPSLSTQNVILPISPVIFSPHRLTRMTDSTGMPSCTRFHLLPRAALRTSRVISPHLWEALNNPPPTSIVRSPLVVALVFSF